MNSEITLDPPPADLTWDFAAEVTFIDGVAALPLAGGEGGCRCGCNCL